MRFLLTGFNLLIVAGILYCSYLLVLLSLPYVVMEPNVDFLQTKQLIYHVDIWRISFYTHVFCSVVIIPCGLLQFSKYILKKQTRLHRISGFIYLVTVVLISGPAAFVMSLYANGDIPAQASFVLLTICWITCTFLAYRAVVKKDYERHGRWMLRSYALTLSAIFLRIYAMLFDLVNLDLQPEATYVLLAWISWTPNLLIAEWMIRRGFVKRLLL